MTAYGQEHGMIVLKFGGTSVGSLERVRNAADIIEAQPQPRAVVVSAASGVTNLLLEAAAKSASGDTNRTAEMTASIRDKHLAIAAGVSDEAERTALVAELDQLHAALDEALADVSAARELSP